MSCRSHERAVPRASGLESAAARAAETSAVRPWSETDASHARMGSGSRFQKPGAVAGSAVMVVASESAEETRRLIASGWLPAAMSSLTRAGEKVESLEESGGLP